VTVTPPTDTTGLPEGAVNLLSDDGTIIYTLGPVAMEGDALSKADAVLNNGEWQVVTAVKGSYRDKANEAFNACYEGGPTCPASGGANGAIAIVLDGTVLSAPSVQGPDLASGDSFQITGDFSESEAKDLALVLRYGSLPVEFEQAALRQVSATLGSDSLRAGLLAGAIGIAALCLYMILYYRGFGMVVVISLLVWMALMYGVVCLLSETQGLALTLAGITGIIVSVGTTVDTYVVVFERVKDEVRKGRSIRRATELGYHYGIRTVITANGAAFIGAFLLWYLTVGPVRGFAYFLGISVIVDLAVAIFFTRPLILLLARSPRFGRARFFGVGAATDQVVASPKVVAS
jgi:preprotein translocase subunit SecD